MKTIIIILAMFNHDAHASANSKNPVGMTVNIEGKQAEDLMNKIIDQGKATFVTNNLVETTIKWENISCTLFGSHGHSSGVVGENYSCSIEL